MSTKIQCLYHELRYSGYASLCPRPHVSLGKCCSGQSRDLAASMVQRGQGSMAAVIWGRSHLSASGMHAVRGALSALQGSKAEERPPARRKTRPLGRAEGGDISGHRLTQFLEQHTALRC